MSYSREPEEALGATPGIVAVNAYKPLPSSMVAKSSALTTTPPPGAAPAAGSAIGMGLVVGGLGLAAFLLYRHFKKKQAGSAPTP